MNEFIERSELICPECGYTETLMMPTDYCQWFYECVGCRALLTPLPGDCCVFCSYGSAPCPSIQLQSTGQITGGCCGVN